MSKIRLASFDVNGGVFSTVQGHGVKVGLPMTFVRLHGCDFSCSWCDTKETWREGSTFTEVDVSELARTVSETPERWVSVTGGNPLLQGDAVVELIKAVPHKRFMVETQASVHHEGVYESLHLASFSPKLHDLRLETLKRSFPLLMRRGVPVQVNVVVTSEAEVRTAIRVLEEIDDCYRVRSLGTTHPRADLTLYLTPEFKTGRAGVQTTIRVLREEMDAGLCAEVRVLPQVHKLALFVP